MSLAFGAWSAGETHGYMHDLPSCLCCPMLEQAAFLPFPNTNPTTFEQSTVVFSERLDWGQVRALPRYHNGLHAAVHKTLPCKCSDPWRNPSIQTNGTKLIAVCRPTELYLL